MERKTKKQRIVDLERRVQELERRLGDQGPGFPVPIVPQPPLYPPGKGYEIGWPVALAPTCTAVKTFWIADTRM
jgi:hypothetical protein